MFTQKRPERLVIGQVLDERAAQKPTSGGSSETEKKDPTVLPAAFSAIRGRGLRRTVGSQAGLAKERHYLRIESVDSLGVVEPSHRHARDAKTADPREGGRLLAPPPMMLLTSRWAVSKSPHSSTYHSK